MPRKNLKLEPQSKKFIEAAHKAEADESESAFEASDIDFLGH